MQTVGAQLLAALQQPFFGVFGGALLPKTESGKRQLTGGSRSI